MEHTFNRVSRSTLTTFCYFAHFFLFNFFLIAMQRGGIRLSIKRDDETDMLATGNKIRKLSFLLADAIAQVLFALHSTFVRCRFIILDLPLSRFTVAEHVMTALGHRAATRW